MCSAGGLLFSQSDPFLPPEVSSDDITVNEVMAALQETARRMSTGAVFQGSSRMIHGSMGPWVVVTSQELGIANGTGSALDPDPNPKARG